MLGTFGSYLMCFANRRKAAPNGILSLLARLPGQSPTPSRRWCVTIVCLGVAASLCLPWGYSYGQPASDSLKFYAVDIFTDATAQVRYGVGIYFGRGLILTAAHVVDPREPTVRIAGQYLPAQVVGISGFEELDLALLSVDEKKVPAHVGLRRVTLCRQPLLIGKAVDIVSTDGVTSSKIMSPRLLPPNARQRFQTVIPDVATTGNSGSGVFDAESKCLAGIMSRKIFVRSGPLGGEKDIAKYFVPAATIAVFIANTASLNRLAP